MGLVAGCEVGWEAGLLLLAVPVLVPVPAGPLLERMAKRSVDSAVRTTS